ncbi:MAG: prepilin-type N-terminal cleavage/methylation domain-containing protein [Armatimonadetes bacterium]|nr:prepilin-type N-terminal cleavage/methylation domain-containing protein [Armatimonadota bacterium]
MRRGFTLFEMCCCSALFALGAAVAVAVGGVWGTWAGLAAFPLSIAAAVLLFMGFAYFWMWLTLDWLPFCHNEKCSGDLRDPNRDYDWQREGADFLAVCKCGHRYRRIGPRFLRVKEDGSLEPYLRRGRLRGWVKDTQPPPDG